MVLAVIQATHSSLVFPGKSMAAIDGKTVLEYIVTRLSHVPYVSTIILATSTETEDDNLCEEANRLRVKIFRGSKEDIIYRICKAAVQFENEETILKINGNYPLFDPFLASKLINDHFKGGFDFSYNEHLYGVLYGTGCEVIEKKLLMDANTKKLSLAQRLSGFLYFRQNSYQFKVNKFISNNPRPHYKVCFETKKDLNLIEHIISTLKYAYEDEIVELFDNNPLLAKSNQYETIKEVGIEKLCLFTDKLSALSRIDHSSFDETYPVSVELSLTNRCNLDCIWCSDKDLRERVNVDMDINVIEELFKDLKSGGTKGVVIEGGGEPTIYKDFDVVVDKACDIGLAVGLITNGCVPLKQDVLDRLEWVRVSLDASNAVEQRKLKGKDFFEKILSNIKLFADSEATTGVGYVVTSENLDSIDELILRLSDMGVSYIQFRPVIDHPQLETDTDLTYLKRYENDSFSIIVDGMSQNVIEGNDNLPCVSHSLTSVIAADGGVYICGRLNIYPWFSTIGNINSESFRNIWLGKKRLKQSNMLLEKSFCRHHCPRCRLTKFNRLLYNIGQIKTKNFI